MVVVNEETKKLENIDGLVRGIVYSDSNYTEYGYFYTSINNIYTELYGNREIAINRSVIPNYIFSKYTGYYKNADSITPTDLHIKGNGDFPYTIERHYEAVKSFDLYKGKQNTQKLVKYNYAKELNYTFGLEFETSQGYIPQDICIEKGLIPLRDGSISGVEYSTVVLEGNKGLNLLKNQIEALKKYTEFNKECALHIHFGGFPVEENSLLCLAELWKEVEKLLELHYIVPPYTFDTKNYKKNGKDYCKRTPYFANFLDLYNYYVGRYYLGSLYQPHPNDLLRTAKWNIKTRYFGLNFINMLCYEGPKTLEFRFLRPTYNFNKIIFWLLLINGVLKYAELETPKYKIGRFRNITIAKIINKIYPKDLAKKLISYLTTLNIVVRTQMNNGDYCGENIYIEEKILNELGGVF